MALSNLKRVVEQAADMRVYRTHALPHGVDLFVDIARSLPKLDIGLVYDIGAHHGESARLFARQWPDATIHSFEPVLSNYSKLVASVGDLANVVHHSIGFSSSADNSRRMGTSGSDFMYRVLPTDVISGRIDDPRVILTTVDKFCGDRSVDHISFMKIDTEGHDLDVLRGAEVTLTKMEVDVIQVEVSMNPRNRDHVPFSDMYNFMTGHDYYVFGIYEQWSEFFKGAPNMRRANVVFISGRVVAQHAKTL